MGQTYTNIREDITEEMKFRLGLKHVTEFAIRVTPDLGKTSMAILCI